MAGVSFDWSQIFGVADIVRNWLPWQVRPNVSAWLIWSGLFVIAAIFCAIVHFTTREKPKVSWAFEKSSGTVVVYGETVNGDNVVNANVQGIMLSGDNISGEKIHHVDGRIILDRDKSTLPLFILLQGHWAKLEDLEYVPDRAQITVGYPFRTDGVHGERFMNVKTIDDLLGQVGGFTVEITLDEQYRKWSFTMDDLRNQFEMQRRAMEEVRLKNFLFRPEAKRKGSS